MIIYKLLPRCDGLWNLCRFERKWLINEKRFIDHYLAYIHSGTIGDCQEYINQHKLIIIEAIYDPEAY